jgi:hypothetical protein
LAVVTVRFCAAVGVRVAVSSATTGWAPVLTLGTWNEHTNSPIVFVVMVRPLALPCVQAYGYWKAPAKETVAPGEALNPEPPTVYVAPTGPWLGLSAIVGIFTVNTWVAVRALVAMFSPTTV